MAAKITIRNILAFAIIAVATVLIVTVVRNVRRPAVEEIIESLPRDVDLSMKEISYTETREGVRRWMLTADAAAHSVGQGTTRIENIHMTFYDVEGLGDLVLTARQGELKTESREVEVRGEVVVQSPKGYAVYTDRLEYREADRTARTEAPVRIVSEGMEVSGTGMRLDLRDHTLVLLSGVRARLAGVGKGEG